MVHQLLNHWCTGRAIILGRLNCYADFVGREQGRGTLILYVCPHSVFEKNNSHPLARIRKLLYTIRDASVAQWIEQWPPEPRA